jgi:hypothetical protein
MKKIFYFTIILSTVLFSCKKESKKSTQQPTYNVSFNVSGFSATTMPFQANSVKGAKSDALTGRYLAALNTQITNLIYMVYDSNGNQIHIINQASTQADFGTIADVLPAGNYVIYFVGYQALQSYFVDILPTSLNFVNTTSGALTQFPDCFVDKVSLTVSPSTPAQNITLSRIDAELTVDIKDAIPSNAVTLQAALSKEYLRYNLSAGAIDTTTSNGATISSTIPSASIGTTDYTFSGIVLNTLHPFNVVLRCLDKNNNVIATKTVSNVTCQINKQTILSGDLFGGGTSGNSVNSSFAVSIDTTWNAPDTLAFSHSLAKRALNHR